jgi:hypothetical protein
VIRQEDKMEDNLSELKKTWSETSEETKRNILEIVLKNNPKLLKTFLKHIKTIKPGFRDIKYIQRLPILRETIDREIFIISSGIFACELLALYFMHFEKNINESWLKMFREKAYSSEESSKEIAEFCLESLKDLEISHDLINIYSITLRIMVPNWFTDKPVDLEALNDLYSKTILTQEENQNCMNDNQPGELANSNSEESISNDLKKEDNGSVKSISEENEKIKKNESDTVNIKNCWFYRSFDNHEQQEIQKSVNQYKAKINELINLNLIVDFNDKGKIDLLILSLIEDRKSLDIELNNFLKNLNACENNDESSICDMKKCLMGFCEKKIELLGDVIEVSKKLVDLESKLMKDVKNKVNEINKLTQQIQDNLITLGKEDKKIINVLDSKSVCKTTKNFNELINISLQIETEVKEKIQNKKNELEQAINALIQNYDTEHKTNLEFRECLDEAHILKARISKNESLGELFLLDQQIEKLVEEFKLKESSDYKRISQGLYSNPDNFSDFLVLCNSLLDKNLPEISFFLLLVRQYVHPIEEISDEIDKSLSLIVRTTCSCSHNQSMIDLIWGKFCSQPWLQGIKHDDIHSNEVLEDILIMSIGAGFRDSPDSVSHIVNQIGAKAVSQQKFTHYIHEILSASKTRRKVRLIPEAEISILNTLRNQISERFDKTGSKYKHTSCSNAPGGYHYSTFENTSLFPALEEKWKKIELGVTPKNVEKLIIEVNSINIDEWYNELSSNNTPKLDKHPLFSDKILKYMKSYVESIKDFLGYYRKTYFTDDVNIEEQKLVDELKLWASNQRNRTKIVEVVIKNFEKKSNSNTTEKEPLYLLSLQSQIIKHIPDFVIWLRSQIKLRIDASLEDKIYQNLSVDFSMEQITNILEKDSAWEHLHKIDPSKAPEYENKLKESLDDLTSKREVVEKLKSFEKLDLFDDCIKNGRIKAALIIFNECNSNLESQLQDEKHENDMTLSSYLEELIRIKEKVDSLNYSAIWFDLFDKYSLAIESKIRRLKRHDCKNDLCDLKNRIRKAIDVLCFCVENNSNNFEEIDFHLNIQESEILYDNVIREDQKNDAEEKHKNLFFLWNSLSDPSPQKSEKKIDDVWRDFVIEFLELCGLYHNESDQDKRFKKVTSIIYPFSIFDTAFYKPKSMFLKKPLRIYLYRSNEVDKQALQRLSKEIDDNSEIRLQIIFTPQGFDKISKYFKYDRSFRGFLIGNDEFLVKTSLSEKHDTPLRQGLHSCVYDLSSSSPFVAQGYCHQDNNLYVGRKDLLTKLLNNSSVMIWGGRRIGKTSILHALRNSLLHHTKNYKVALVYVDIPNDCGDPDLSVAIKIAESLGLDKPKNLTEFEAKVKELRNSGTKVAFLIDEVDEYIKKSRKVHESEFPLSTVLRQLVMDDPKGDTRLVYSGYHQLYFEARLWNTDNIKRRNAHPFVNITQEVPIRNLNTEDVSELILEGFENMLGLVVKPDVPRLIYEKTSGHPAFVQQFCRCILERVSQRRSPGKQLVITSEDIEAVFSENVHSQGFEQPFILYVNETLGLNFSHLGRSIMLAICEMYSAKNTHSEYYFNIDQIKNDIKEYSSIIGIFPPEDNHFDVTIELLLMTNMLTQNNKNSKELRITFPTYIDILKRLDKLKKADIEDWLRKYDAEERHKGVLL